MKQISITVLLLPLSASAETPDEWVTLGARVHGAFGAFIPLGIKIGLDAVKHLDAKPRELALIREGATTRLWLPKGYFWSSRSSRTPSSRETRICRTWVIRDFEMVANWRGNTLWRTSAKVF
jgi:hypothetical protein